MKNIVTPETARKLKKAGFKQTRIEKGQIWYAFESRPYFIFEQSDQFAMGIYLADDFQTAALPAKFIVEKYTFAPTATDILLELGGEYYLGTMAGDFTLHGTFKKGSLCFHSNPAEAAARAWLEKYAK